MINGLSRVASVAAAVVLCAAVVLSSPGPAGASSAIIGAGSSFAGIELLQWASDVSVAPYNYNVNYQSSSSGLGRQSFCSKSVDFAVSDIRYNSLDDSCIPDPTTFEYVPVTAGGIAFMYNLQKEGFTQANPIQLSPKTACGIFGDQIAFWDDPTILADNPGITLPHVGITPVVRNDAAGTNFVLEEYCIALEPDIFTNFINSWNTSPAGKASAALPTNQPTSTWPLLSPITGATGSDGVADTVKNTNDDGFVGAVETGYALQRHFPVASVQNDKNAYVQPSPAAVATALGYATQLDDGTQQLNFSPGDPAAYNPSTYSYMMFSLSASSAIGGAETQFANFCLTLGQREAPTLGYATINRSLIQYGLGRLKAVPGYVAPTDAEAAAIPASASNTNPTTNPTTVTPTAGGGGGGGGGSSSTSTPGGGGTSSTAPPGGGTGSTPSGGGSGVAGTGSTGTGSNGSHGSGGLTAAQAAVNPSATLGSGTGPVAQTGVETDILAGVGLALLVAGELGLRHGRRRRVPA